MPAFTSSMNIVVLSAALLLSGCTSTLVHDDVKRTAGLRGHCAGSEWTDHSSIAILPVPLVAFLMPHVDVHHLSSEPYMSRCGASTQVVNREVSVNRTACIPAGLTRIVSLGIWQWCPAKVTWSADVLADLPRSVGVALEDARIQK